MATTFDAIVVGSGPNGLAAAITLQQQGLSVCIVEGDEIPGGGMRTKELMQKGYWSDVCSAVHPLLAASPFFQKLPLSQYGLEFIQPPVLAAHPLDNGRAVSLLQSLEQTSLSLKGDNSVYSSTFSPLVKEWSNIASDVLAPFHFPKYPFKVARFGRLAIQSGMQFSKRFKTVEAKALWAGMAAHSLLPLENFGTSAVGLPLLINAHIGGWPIPKGGSQAIANVLVKYFLSLGGKIETGRFVKQLAELPRSKVVILDVTPKQLLSIADFSSFPNYKKQLKTYRYGAGVFKMDWILDGQVPFLNESCRNAGTVNIGGTIGEIAASEAAIAAGKIHPKPFVLLAQQSLFDPTRAPEGKQVLWGYCHVPNGSNIDCTDLIENQIERFAPGFKKRIVHRHTMTTSQMENYNPNYIGGDINGGKMRLRQLFFKPFYKKSPYKTPLQNIYICSSSTPPGGGVHGMCGYNAAKQVLKDVWNLHL